MISAKDLMNADITISSNGYNCEEVDGLINQAAQTISARENENSELYRKLEILANKVEEYRSQENAITTALVKAEQMAQTVEKDASEKSQTLLSDSREKAKATLDEANASAEKIISDAREYASKLIEDKTAEAQRIVLDAQNKANEAINSSKIIAKNITDQAKEISEDLTAKSKAEREAYEILINVIKDDAKSFVEKLKELYRAQLDVLENSKLDTDSTIKESEAKVEDIGEDIGALYEEIDEISYSIPEPVQIVEQAEEDPVAEEEPAVQEEAAEETAEAVEEAPVAQSIIEDEFEIIEEDPTAAEEETEIDNEPADPMEAVEAFSKNEITPIQPTAIPEISDEDESLFDESDAQLPFETYFNVKKEDAHNDPTQTISLVPPEDDDDDEEPKFKGFFKKKK